MDTRVGNGVILTGDCADVMRRLPAGGFRCCVTSPPYWGLRRNPAGGVGGEATVHEYVDKVVAIFREVRRVLADDGTLWLNIGDTFAASGSRDPRPKNLVGVPWRVAFSLQADGWFLRSEVIWFKGAGKPESVGTHGHSGRPTRAHEQVFLLTKGPVYYYDLDASPEPSADGQGRNRRSVWEVKQGSPYRGIHTAVFPPGLVEPCVQMGSSEAGRCPKCWMPWIRDLRRGQSTYARLKEEQGVGWREMQGESERRGTAMKGGIAGCGGTRTATGGAAHLARAPRETLGWRPSCQCGAEPEPELVLDPFLGSGTVGSVCEGLGRRWCGIELSAEYAALARERVLHDLARAVTPPCGTTPSRPAAPAASPQA